MNLWLVFHSDTFLLRIYGLCFTLIHSYCDFMSCVSLWRDLCGWLGVLYQKTICSFFLSFFLLTKGLTIPGMFRCFVVRCCFCLFALGDVVVVVCFVVVGGGGYCCFCFIVVLLPLFFFFFFFFFFFSVLFLPFFFFSFSSFFSSSVC